MAKIMIFIDGSWLYANQYLLEKKFGGNYRLDYGKLPEILGEVISGNLGNKDVDIVRTYLFGSNAINYATQDDYLVQQRRDFFDILKEEYHYEVEIFPINYRGKKLKKADRSPNDDFSPQEKCVDIALATSMLYFAAIPYAYDIAVAVIGDRDFMPMLQRVRRLGKRVAIASIKESCANEYSDPKDIHRLKDFDIIWLGDYLDKLELQIQKRRVECESPFHKGDRFVYTDDFIRKGAKYYCKACKEKYRSHKAEEKNSFRETESLAVTDDLTSTRRRGKIKSLKNDRGFGFIACNEGDYYFHFTELRKEIDCELLKMGDYVEFEVEIEPNQDDENPNGRAINVEIIEAESVNQKNSDSNGKAAEVGAKSGNQED